LSCLPAKDVFLLLGDASGFSLENKTNKIANSEILHLKHLHSCTHMSRQAVPTL
jgi:hypothetical protein